MLVLSRAESEVILIGDSIAIQVVAIRGDKVRLGIAAPKDVPVHRAEVAARIAAELAARATREQPAENPTEQQPGENAA